ncbi:hypothetical protein C8A03DRAFT_40019 [Achaetomium macrosporum]|uniref:Abscission/NoCut checkpoint regulator n=1 Tax=Achaetomium macrosporum TaxID=79813 RepID=A0AAN7CKZ3_9PEZI|nr:hypothetical protein C8A03DRAFT_40019 [Achaetomium macrosporum]
MPCPDDQSLLDRLNALRPPSISLGKSANSALSPGPKAQPVSREDALTERLRLLRSQPVKISRDENVSHGRDLPQPPGIPGGNGVGRAASPPVEPPAVDLSRDAKDKAVSKAPSVSPTASENGNQKRDPYYLPELGEDDEDAFDVLLEGFAHERFDLAADDDAAHDLEPRRDAWKVAELLESLQNRSRSSDSKNMEETLLEDDDDSDGEQMAHAVNTVLSQIGDEINSLPAPPDILERYTPSEEPRDEQNSTAIRGDESLLTLPAVPSQLVDPVLATKEEDTFEKNIASRLASLRGLGSLDELGLPSAPTFRPQDRRTSSTILGKGLLRSSKYTDEDQTTWCVVCLEDAAIRCVGCDNDAYCARCWKEMHVGPSAGYDERGHNWVKFERSSHS